MITSTYRSVLSASTNVANELQERRELLNLSISQVANYVGVSRRTYTRWESGESQPKLTKPQFDRLKEIFNCKSDTELNHLLGI